MEWSIYDLKVFDFHQDTPLSLSLTPYPPSSARSYYYACVLIPLYVSSYYYICPHTNICPRTTIDGYQCPHTMYVLTPIDVCPHPTMYVSSYVGTVGDANSSILSAADTEKRAYVGLPFTGTSQTSRTRFGTCVSQFVYYETIKWEIYRRHIWVSVWWKTQR